MHEPHESRASGLQESARRVERTLEIVRDELGNLDGRPRDWKGLCQHVTRGRELTRAFARALTDFGQAEVTDPHSMLVHVFTLRQLEIAMNLIARMGEEMEHLEQRLKETEEHLLGMVLSRHVPRS